MDIYIGLLHHPVRNRLGETVTTAVTNLDIHDLTRAARTYDVRATYFVTPIEQQRSLVQRIIAHWQGGEGAEFNPVRAIAFERTRVSETVDEAILEIESETGHKPLIVVTGAQLNENTTSYNTLRQRIEDTEGSLLLLFGTGWGLTDEFINGCDMRLPGINAVPGHDDYNHLSVRSAVSIILDRLLGDRSPSEGRAP